MSQVKQEVLNWIHSNKVVVYSPVYKEFDDGFVLPLSTATGKETLYTEKYVLLHKGQLSKVPSNFWAMMAGRSEVVFANAVFIIFRMRQINAKERDDIKSFYNYAFEQLSSAELEAARAPVRSAQASRFCHYIGNQTILTETFFGRKIYLDSDDISLTPHIMYDGTWEPWITKLITNELKTADVFVDIGANCGFYSLLAAHIVGPQGFVISVEPQKTLASKLMRSLDINGFGGFATVAQVAAGETQTQAALGRFEAHKGSASLVPGDNYASASERIEVKPLPDILTEIGRRFNRLLKPNFIKIDVEGYEYFAWLGMRDFLNEGTPMKIVMEFSPIQYMKLGQDPKAFVQDIFDLGFSLTWLHHNQSEEPFDLDSIDKVIASNNFADLVLRR